MKKILYGVLIFCSAGILSCKKDNNDPPGTPAAVSYMNINAGNTWNYENTRTPSGTPVITNYSITATSQDSTINGKPYRKFTRTDAFGSEYYYNTGNDYYEYLSLPVLDTIRSENLFLRSNASIGDHWTQNLSPVTYFGITANLAKLDTVIEKNMTKTVKGITYDSVIFVRGSLKVLSIVPPLVTPVLTSTIENYYAPRVGRIASNINVHLSAPAPFAIDERFENKIELVSTNF